jgi:restriction system protein
MGRKGEEVGRSRKNDGVLDLIIEMTSGLPWWVSLILGGILYGVFGSLRTGAHVMVQPIYFACQIALPLACCIGAIVSMIRRRKHAQLFDQVATNPAQDILQQMSWREFEMLVGEAFRLQGYSVEENGGGRPDGGIDLVLWRDSQKHIVQCKRWKTYRVGPEVVREQYGILTAIAADGAIIVTSGHFTEAARQFAKNLPIRLIDGPELRRMIAQVQAKRAQTSSSGALKKGQRRDTREATSILPKEPVLLAESRLTAQDVRNLIPVCPRCQQSMVQRTAKMGSLAGQAFWGCSTFPACRGTRPFTPARQL